MRRLLRSLFLSLGIVSAASSALGQPAPGAPEPGPAESSAADQRYAEAQEHYRAKRYTEALPIFRELATASGSPNAWLYVGRCLRELGELPGAYDTLALTLQLATARVATEPRFIDSRDAAQRELRDLEARVGRASLYLPARPVGLELELNGVSIPAERWAAPIAVMPGTVRVWAKAPGYAGVRQEVEIPAGRVTSVTIVLSALEPAPPPAAAPSTPSANVPPPPPPPPTVSSAPPTIGSGAPTVGSAPAPAPTTPPGEGSAAADGGSSGMTIAGAVAIVVGGLGFGTFITAGTMANDRFAEVEKTCGGERCTDPAINDDIDAGRTMDHVANVGLGVGIVGVVLGTLLIAVDLAGDDAPASSGPAGESPRPGMQSTLELGLAPGGGFVGWRGRF